MPALWNLKEVTISSRSDDKCLLNVGVINNMQMPSKKVMVYTSSEMLAIDIHKLREEKKMHKG